MRELILAASIYVAVGFCVLGQMGKGNFPLGWIDKPPKLRQKILLVLVWPLAVAWAWARRMRNR
jgi:hypothetical protein